MGGDIKRNILVYFLDCYLKNNCVRTAYKCNKYHTVYKDIDVCPVKELLNYKYSFI